MKLGENEIERIRSAVLVCLADGSWHHRGEALYAGWHVGFRAIDRDVGRIIAQMTRDGVIEARGFWSKKSDTREVRLAPEGAKQDA